MKILRLLLQTATVFSIVLAPWFLGGASQRVHGALCVAALVLLLGTTLVRLTRRSNTIVHSWWLLLPILLIGLNLIPLPIGFWEVVAPHLNALRQNYLIESPEALAPLSLATGDTRLMLSRYWLAVAFLVVSSELFDSRTSQTCGMAAMAINGLMLSTVGLVQRLGFASDLFWENPNPFLVGFGPFVNRNNAAGYLSACAAAGIAFLFNDWKKSVDAFVDPAVATKQRSNQMAKKLLLGLAVATNLMAILFSYCRGSYVALLACVVAIVFFVQRQRFLTGILGFGAVSVAALLLIWWAGAQPAVMMRMGEINADELTGELVRHWKDDLSMVSDSWLVGSGFGVYPYLNRAYQTIPTDQWYLYSENVYLETLVAGGCVSLVVLILFIAVCFSAVMRQLRQADRHHVKLGVMGLCLLTSQTVTAFFDYGLIHSANFVLVAFLLGLVMRSMRCRERHQSTLSEIAFSFVVILVGVYSTNEAICHARIESAMGGTIYGASQVDNPMLNRDGVNDLEQQIFTLERAMNRCQDHALAQARLGDFYVMLSRYKLFEQMTTDFPHAQPEAIWASTRVEIVSARVNTLKQQDATRYSVVTNDSSLQEFQTALGHYRKSNAACPLLPRVHYRIALLEHLFTEEQLDMAGVDRCLALVPMHSNLHLAAGATALMANDFDRAEQWIRRGLRLGGRLDDRLTQLVVQQWTPEEFVRQIVGENIELAWRLTNDLQQYDRFRTVLAGHVISLANDRTDELSDWSPAQVDCFAAAANGTLGLTDEALNRYARCFSENGHPDLVDFRYRYALLLRQNGQLSEAFSQADFCCRQHPVNGTYLRLRKSVGEEMQQKIRR